MYFISELRQVYQERTEKGTHVSGVRQARLEDTGCVVQELDLGILVVVCDHTAPIQANTCHWK